MSARCVDVRKRMKSPLRRRSSLPSISSETGSTKIVSPSWFWLPPGSVNWIEAGSHPPWGIRISADFLPSGATSLAAAMMLARVLCSPLENENGTEKSGRLCTTMIALPERPIRMKGMERVSPIQRWTFCSPFLNFHHVIGSPESCATVFVIVLVPDRYSVLAHLRRPPIHAVELVAQDRLVATVITAAYHDRMAAFG